MKFQYILSNLIRKKTDYCGKVALSAVIGGGGGGGISQYSCPAHNKRKRE